MSRAPYLPPLKIYVLQDSGEPGLIIIVKHGRETIAKERINEEDVIFADERDMTKPISNAVASISKKTGISPQEIAKLMYEGENARQLRSLIDRNYSLRRRRNPPVMPPPVKEEVAEVESEPEKTGWDGLLDNIGKAMQRSVLPSARVVKDGDHS